MAARDQTAVVMTWMLVVASVTLVIYILMVLYSGYWQSQSGASSTSGNSSRIMVSASGKESERGTVKNNQAKLRVPSDSPVPPVRSETAPAPSDAEQEVDSEVESAPASTTSAAGTEGPDLLEETDDSDSGPDYADTKAALPDAESATERSARMIRETLGIKDREAPQAAVIVQLMVAESCLTKNDLESSLPIFYRYESPTIRTSSVNELRSLLSSFRRCEGSEFHMMLSGIETSEALALMRFNELKYFFTQNSVPKSALHYHDTP